jgi:hypothetical protein
MAEYPTLLGGIGKGLGDAANIIGGFRNIQKQDEAEARAIRQEGVAAKQELRNQGIYEAAMRKDTRDTEEYNRIHQPSIDVEALLAEKTADMDEPGKQYVISKAKPFLGNKKKISVKEFGELKENLFTDKDFVNGMFTHKDRSIGQQLIQAENEGNTPAAIQLEQKREALRQAHPQWMAMEKMKIDTAHQKEMERISSMQANTASEIATKTAAHQAAVDKHNSEVLKIQGQAQTFAKQRAAVDDALKIIQGTGNKTVKEVINPETGEKETRTSLDWESGVRNGFAVNERVMLDAGYTKPKEMKADWPKTWIKAAAALNPNARVKMTPEGVVSMLKKQAADEGVTLTPAMIDEQVKLYPALKGIQKYFVEKKEDAPAASSPSYQPPLQPGERTVGEVISSGAENTGIFGTNPPRGYGVVQRGNVRDAAKKSGTLGINAPSGAGRAY